MYYAKFIFMIYSSCSDCSLVWCHISVKTAAAAPWAHNWARMSSEASTFYADLDLCLCWKMSKVWKFYKKTLCACGHCTVAASLSENLFWLLSATTNAWLHRSVAIESLVPLCVVFAFVQLCSKLRRFPLYCCSLPTLDHVSKHFQEKLPLSIQHSLSSFFRMTVYRNWYTASIYL